MPRKVIISPVKKTKMVPAMDTGNKHLSQLLVNGFLNLCKVILAEVSSFTSTKDASEEPLLLVFILADFDLVLSFFINGFVDVLFFVIAFGLNVEACTNDDLKSSQDLNDVSFLINHQVIKV